MPSWVKRLSWLQGEDAPPHYEAHPRPQALEVDERGRLGDGRAVAHGPVELGGVDPVLLLDQEQGILTMRSTWEADRDLAVAPEALVHEWCTRPALCDRDLLPGVPDPVARCHRRQPSFDHDVPRRSNVLRPEAPHEATADPLLTGRSRRPPCSRTARDLDLTGPREPRAARAPGPPA